MKVNGTAVINNIKVQWDEVVYCIYIQYFDIKPVMAGIRTMFQESEARSHTHIPPEVLAKRARCEEMEIQIITEAARINATNYSFIKLLGEFDEEDGWCGDGIKSFSHWLNWKIGGAAQAWAR